MVQFSLNTIGKSSPGTLAAIYAPSRFFQAYPNGINLWFLLLLLLATSALSAALLPLSFSPLAALFPALQPILNNLTIAVALIPIISALSLTFCIKLFTITFKKKRSFLQILRVVLFQNVFFIPLLGMSAAVSAVPESSAIAGIGMFLWSCIGFFWFVSAITGLHGYSKIGTFFLALISGVSTAIPVAALVLAVGMASSIQLINNLQGSASPIAQLTSPLPSQMGIHKKLPAVQEPAQIALAEDTSKASMKMASFRQSDPESRRWEAGPAEEDQNVAEAQEVSISQRIVPSAEELKCENGDALACIEVGVLNHLNQNLEEARAAFARGCTLRSIKSCERAAEVEELLGNTERAAMYRRVLCRLGYKAHCA